MNKGLVITKDYRKLLLINSAAKSMPWVNLTKSLMAVHLASNREPYHAY